MVFSIYKEELTNSLIQFTKGLFCKRMTKFRKLWIF